MAAPGPALQLEALRAGLGARIDSHQFAKFMDGKDPLARSVLVTTLAGPLSMMPDNSM